MDKLKLENVSKYPPGSWYGRRDNISHATAATEKKLDSLLESYDSCKWWEFIKKEGIRRQIFRHIIKFCYITNQKAGL